MPHENVTTCIQLQTYTIRVAVAIIILFKLHGDKLERFI